MPGGEQIPLLVTEPIQSLGRQYTAELSDKQMGKTIQKQLSDGLARIDRSQLPGKYKVWCYQFTLYQRVMWPLKMCQIPSSTASLFGRNILQVPLQSISLCYKQGKTRLVQELRESTNQLVRCADAQVRNGRKWKAQGEVDQAISRLQQGQPENGKEGARKAPA
ncbi:hypothetical protein AAFF_G00059780 [Aldrovandia affinis]|uniref:Uncharacterized protein n=1 Tax=Aldrovandia affinis TaxID=143900 RepID=A0AAD7S034_9TELE|nr:hypothetical protein AAFF_G00059780 [Aldrovandia affinis]